MRKHRIKILNRQGDLIALEELLPDKKKGRVQYWANKGGIVEEVIDKHEYGRLKRELYHRQKVDIWRLRRGAELI